MPTTVYTSLTRQSGLVREMQVIANNIANMSTRGYRQQGVVFSEFVQDTGDDPSLSMAEANSLNTAFLAGQLTETRAPFDFAIEGDGFFLVETQRGERLTRAGSFQPNDLGELVSPEGFRLLDIGRAPILITGDAAEIFVAPDGTISNARQPIAQIGVFVPTQPETLKREDGVLFDAGEEFEPTVDASLRRGFLEGSNVNPILQVARMIEVQRSYEMGQKFLDREDSRIRDAMKAFTR